MLLESQGNGSQADWEAACKSRKFSRNRSAILNRPFYSCVPSDLAFEWKRGWRWPCFDTNPPAFLMLTSLHLHMKSRRVCIKTRSPSASLPLKGQVTRHTTVKWPISCFLPGVLGEVPDQIDGWRHINFRRGRLGTRLHGNQAIAGRECKKGEPKASHTDSKRLFVLKAKTLERQGAFVCLKKFACCSQVPRSLSLHYGFLQARRAAS